MVLKLICRQINFIIKNLENNVIFIGMLSSANHALHRDYQHWRAGNMFWTWSLKIPAIYIYCRKALILWDIYNKAIILADLKNWWYHRFQFLGLNCRLLLCICNLQTLEILWYPFELNRFAENMLTHRLDFIHRSALASWSKRYCFVIPQGKASQIFC